MAARASRGLLVAGVVALALIPVVAPVVAQDDGGGFLENLIEDRLSGPGFDVEVRGFSGALSSRATLETLVISDDEGPWLTLNDAVLDWNRSALLRGRLEVEELTAAELVVPRRPVPDDSLDMPAPEARPFSLPDLPVAVRIDRLDIARVALGEPLFGAAAELSVEGSARLANGEGQVDIEARRIDGEQGTFGIAGAFANADRRLTLDVAVDEGPDGIVVNLLDIPDHPALALTVEGDGPLSDFAAEIALATAGEPRLAGSVALTEVDGVRRFAVDLGGDIAPVFTPQYRPFFGPAVALQATGAQFPDGRIVVDTLALTAQSLTLEGELALAAGGLPERFDLQGVIASDDGPVLLPFGAVETRIDRAALDLQFDAAQSDAWTGVVRVAGLDRAELAADEIVMQGAGTIAAGSGAADAPASVTADLTFAATGLDTADPGLGQALGDAAVGNVAIRWSEGAPVLLDRLELEGASYALTGQGRVDPSAPGVPAALTAQLDAADLAAFSVLAGRDLRGAASLSVDVAADVTGADLDLSLDGTVDDLRVGIRQLDPLLGGRTVLTVRADRDQAGTRLTELTAANPAVRIAATADLASEASTIDASAAVPDLSVLDPALEGPGRITLEAAQEGILWRVALDAEAAGAVIDGDGTVTLAEAAAALAEGTLAVAAEDIARFADLAGRDLAGSLAMTVAGSGRTDGSTIDATLDGTLNDFAIGLPQVDNLLGGATTLAATLSKDGAIVAVPRLIVENPQVTARGEARYAPNDNALDLDVTLPDLSAVVPELDGAATLTATGVQDGEVWRVTVDGQAAGAAVTVEASVTDLGLPQAEATGTARIAADDIARFSSLAGDRALSGSIDVTLDGTARLDLATADVALEGTLRDLGIGQPALDNLLGGTTDIAARVTKAGDMVAVPSLAIENPQITVSGEGRYAPGDNALDLNVTVPDLSAVVPELDGAAALTATGVQDGDIWRLDVDAAAGDATLDADVAIADLGGPDAAATGTAQVVAADIARFRPLAGGRNIGGSIDMALDGTARLDLATADVALDGTLRDLALGQAEADNLLDGLTTLSARVTRDDAVIAVPRLAVANPQIVVEGDARYAPEGASALDLTIALPELSEVVATLDGPAAADVTGVQDGEIWRVTLDAAGAGATAIGAVDVTGLGRPRMAVDGTLRLAAADLAPFRPLAGRDVGGGFDVTLTGTARTDLSTLDLAVAGTLDDLAIGQPTLDNLLDGTTTLAAAVTRNGRAIALPELAISNPQIVATAMGDIGSGQDAIEAQIDLPDLSAIAPALDGAGTATLVARESGEIWQVALDAAGGGAVVDVLAEVTAPFDTDRAVAGRASIAAEDLSRFRQIAGRPLSGSLEVEAEGAGRLDGSRFDVTVAATGQGVGIGLPPLDGLLDGPLSLALEARRAGPRAPVVVDRFDLDTAGLDARASGRILGGESDLDLTARLADVGAFVPGLDGPFSIAGTVREAGDAIGVDLAGDGPGGIALSVDGTVAQDFDSADLAIGGLVPLALANQFIEPRALSGTARLDLSLDGPLALASLGGRVATQDARVIAPALGIALDDVNLVATLGANTLRLDGTARNAAGGTLAVAGPIALTPGYAANIDIRADRFLVEDPRLYRAVIDGAVTIEGPLAGAATVAGELRLAEAEVRIPSTGLGATGPIPDGLTHVNEPAEVRATRARADLLDDDAGNGGSGAGGRGGYALDLSIIADNQIFVRGRGLDAELGGRLRLTGTTADVIPAGQFALIRGRLDLLGRRLELDEGRISLQGDFTPLIRLVARTDAGDVTVAIIVEGPALSPEITFTAQPDLPQDEVLARLLFGQSIDNISALQAAQLASAVATLAGRGGGGIIANLRENFGLDDLDVTTDDEGNVGVRAGAYLSENVYTDVTVGASGDAEINLNLDVTDSVTVRGGTSSAGGTSLGIYFERDY